MKEDMSELNKIIKQTITKADSESFSVPIEVSNRKSTLVSYLINRHTRKLKDTDEELMAFLNGLVYEVPVFDPPITLQELQEAILKYSALF